VSPTREPDFGEAEAWPGKLPASSGSCFPACCPARLSGRHCNGLSRLGSSGVSGRRYQLAQDLGRRLWFAFPQLAHGGSERSPERRRHGETGEPLFQSLHSSPMRPLERRRIEQQILGYAERQPEREDSASLGAPSGLGEQREQGTGRRMPAVHGMNRPTVR
jgi:hypothetical protein